MHYIFDYILCSRCYLHVQNSTLYMGIGLHTKIIQGDDGAGGVPEGWKVTVTTRKSGESKGMKDKKWVSPDGAVEVRGTPARGCFCSGVGRGRGHG